MLREIIESNETNPLRKAIILNMETIPLKKLVGTPLIPTGYVKVHTTPEEGDSDKILEGDSIIIALEDGTALATNSKSFIQNFGEIINAGVEFGTFGIKPYTVQAKNGDCIKCELFAVADESIF